MQKNALSRRNDRGFSSFIIINAAAVGAVGKTNLDDVNPRKRQGRLLAFGMTGAMALALSACDNPSQVMISPPGEFDPNRASAYTNTNQPPSSSSVCANPGCGAYLGGHGYYPVYGYPGYFYRPAPGSTVELVRGSGNYSAGSPEEARASVARGGFGESGGGHGEGGGE